MLFVTTEAIEIVRKEGLSFPVRALMSEKQGVSIPNNT